MKKDPQTQYSHTARRRVVMTGPRYAAITFADLETRAFALHLAEPCEDPRCEIHKAVRGMLGASPPERG